jgi:Fe-S cluster assembly scaffold protein SufB
MSKVKVADILTPSQQKHLAEYHLYSDQNIGCMHSPLTPTLKSSPGVITIGFENNTDENNGATVNSDKENLLTKFYRDERNEPLALWQNLEQIESQIDIPLQDEDSNISINFNANMSMAGRAFLVVQENKTLNLDISYLTPAASSFVLFLDVQKNACINIVSTDQTKGINEGFLYLNAKLDESAQLNFFGYKNSRLQSLQHIQVELGDNSIANVHELVHGSNGSLQDSHIIYKHTGAGTLGTQNVLQLINDKSTAAFTGKIDVGREAFSTESYQLCNSLLLCDHSKACHRPQLEIENKDVKCSHGATSGKLDEEALFYLRARGFAKPYAEKLLIAAKVGEFISNSKLAASQPWLIDFLKEQELGFDE